MEEQKCLVEGLDHNYEFAGSGEGVEYWVCTRCPSFLQEFVDSQP